MHLNTRLAQGFTRAAIPALLALAAGAAGADTVRPVAPMDGPWNSNTLRPSFLLAQGTAATTNESTTKGGGKSVTARGQDAVEAVDAPWYGRNNVHKYLGLGSLAAAALTMVTPKKEGGAHERLADAAAVLGVAAVGTGAYAHWNDLDLTWRDPDTKHAVFGALGTLGFLLAVAKGGEGGHAAAGALGAVSMAVAVKYTW